MSIFICNFVVNVRKAFTLFKNIIFKNIFLIAVLLLTSGYSYSQVMQTGVYDTVRILLRKEHSFSINVHSQGFGVGYRQGKNLTVNKKFMYEGELLTLKHLKEKKFSNPYLGQNAKPYIFGKLNYLFILRNGLGIQNILNNKPFWGGVEVRYFYFAGIDIALAKPVYLYVNFEDSENNIKKYDESVSQDNIYGRAPFHHGLNEIKPYAGLYSKIGLNFEFGENPEKIRCLETGLNLDFFPFPIPVMAFRNKDYYFLTVYISYAFGKRKL